MTALKILGWAIAWLVVSPAIAVAQTPDDLERARALFEDALHDQEAGRADAALEKFRGVAKVRDTSQVEFRVASCLEALGRKHEALRTYELSVRLGRGDTQVQDVVDAANERISKLAATMGKLDVDVLGASADRAEVRIDGDIVTPEERHAPILLEGGTHTIDVQAPDAKPAHTTVNVVVGERAGVSVQLAAAHGPDAAPTPSSNTRRDIGIVLASVGGVSAVGAGLALFFRHDTIATIEADCPGNTCPPSRRDEIEGLRSTATALGPVAAVLAGVAAAGLGAGVVLIALGPQKAPASMGAWLAPSIGGVTLGGCF